MIRAEVVTINEAAGETLPALSPISDMIKRAAVSLAASSHAGEVLDIEAKMSAAVLAAKAVEKMAKAQAAHDEVIRATHKAQGDALDIKAAASRRYYEMVQQAQEAGEIPVRGGDRRSEDFKVSEQNFENPARHKVIAHEGKLIAEAEKREPGIVRRTIDNALDDGRAPTKADIKRAIGPSEYLNKRGADEEREFMDKRDFKAFRKLWRTMSPGAKELAKNYIATERA